MPLIPQNALADSIATMVRRRSAIPYRSDPSVQISPSATEEQRLLVDDRVPLEQVLRGRRSVREFDVRPPTEPVLSNVLDLADRCQRDQWPSDAHGDAGLRLLVSAFRVNGLDCGLHERLPAADAWRWQGSPDWLPTLQRRYAAAPAVVLVCGPLSRAETESYGALIVRAAALGYAVWLAARTFDLDCSVYGATAPEVSRTVGEHQNGDRHLFTIALGYPDSAS